MGQSLSVLASTKQLSLRDLAIQDVMNRLASIYIIIMFVTVHFLGKSAITEVPQTKCLRVTIDQKLSWNEHTQRITSKANKVNSFLHCNLHQCPVNVKYNCYKMMVQPVIEYTSIACLGPLHPNRLESIQWRAARFCCND